MSHPSRSPIQHILSPLPDLSTWVARLGDARQMPILAATSSRLGDLRRDEDRVDANGLGQLIASDPLMTLKVLAQVSTQAGLRPVADMRTVTAALVMMGIPPFFRTFGPQPTIEDALADDPMALLGMRRRIQRARAAASFALALAQHRMESDAAVIHAAALLHDFAELLLWCHAPLLALRLADAEQRRPELSPRLLQLEVLEIDLADVQEALTATWRLPHLLTRADAGRHAPRSNRRCVELGVRLARHQQAGWESAAMADDIEAVAQLLNLTSAAASQVIQAV